MSYLRYLCLFVHSGVQHILRFVFVLFIRHVYPMLPVSLDFPFLIAHSQQIEQRNNLNVSCKLESQSRTRSPMSEEGKLWF